jgi:rod shape-determining protein MreD
MTFVATFVMARAAGVRLAAQTMWMQAILALAFALVHSVMVLVLLAIFAKDSDKGWVARSLYPLALPHSLATAVIAPIIFRISKKLHAITASAPRPEAGGGRA